VQFGGQTPLKLANALHEEGIPILGTTPDAIDLAEDRERFQKLLNDLGLKQPVNGIARSREKPSKSLAACRLPLVIRPSYVLGGRAMEIVRDMDQLEPLHHHRRCRFRATPGAARQLSFGRDRG
jgi:carbamoyl-phosphate synthase large subunit